MAVSVDLGCGAYPKNPFNASVIVGLDKFVDESAPAGKTQGGEHTSAQNSNVDFLFLNHDVIFEALPFQRNSIDYFTAFDFLEHVPRAITSKNGDLCNPFINLMNQIYKCLKNGGIFYHYTPLFPHNYAFADPTHVNFITEKTIRYFCGKHLDKKKEMENALYPVSRSYGIEAEFVLIESSLNKDNTHIRQTLLKS